MTQAERQERSSQRIFEAAMAEFSADEYETVSMGRICSRHRISKGLMYHYFKSKDELFLLCVEDSFRALGEYIRENAPKADGENTRETIRDFFMLREEFLRAEPQRRRILEAAVFHPPANLEAEIEKLHEPIFRLDQDYLRDVVAHMPLRDGVKAESVIRMMDGIGYLIRAAGRRGIRFEDLDEAVSYFDETLDMALYGVLRPNCGEKEEKK